MTKLKDISIAYFKRRTAFRILLVLVISSLWGYSELGDFYQIPSHDLNYKAITEVKARYTGGDITFAVVGDPKNSPVFDSVISKINQDQDISFVIVVGDIVLYPTVETYRAFLAQRAELRVPSIVLPGNHDVAFKNYYYYQTIFGRFYNSFVLGENQFILLDNSNEERINEEQSSWLRSQLADGLAYKNQIVFMHVPLWDPRDTNEFGVRFSHSLNDIDATRKLEDLFRESKISLLFEGHIHGYYDVEDSGLHRIISGGGGAALSGSDPQHAFYHYIKVKITGPQIQTTGVTVEQPSGKAMGLYVKNAWLYLVTFLKLYRLQVILGPFLILLLSDMVLEYFYRKRSDAS